MGLSMPPELAGKGPTPPPKLWRVLLLSAAGPLALCSPAPSRTFLYVGMGPESHSGFLTGD